ncbi:MAG: hypothetical protein J6K45_04270 [Clostridia bacterium]|nr:hypothetical protein [Clostridia bacterium]
MGNIKEPKYDNDLINLGYLKKTINNSEKEMESKNDSIYSKSYTSPPIPPYYAGATYYSGNKIYRCVKDRLVGSFSLTDWVVIYDEKQNNLIAENFIFLSEVDIKEQSDDKIETFYQDNDPSNDWDTSIKKAEHEGDYWRTLKEGIYHSYVYTKMATNPITYDWLEITVPIAIFDTISGHKNIFTSIPNDYTKNDFIRIMNDEMASNFNFDIEIGNFLYTAVDNTSFNSEDWLKKEDELSLKSLESYYYTTDEINKIVEIINDNIEADIIKSSNSIKAFVKQEYTEKTTTEKLTKKVDSNGKTIEKIIGTNTSEIPTLNLSELSILLDQISATVSKSLTLTNTLTNNDNIVLTEAVEGNIIEFSIKGKMSLLFPSKKLYPSSNLYGKTSNLIIEYEDGTQEKIRLPVKKLRKIGEVSDEFIINSTETKLIKRIGVDENNEEYLLSEEKVIQYDNITIPLKNGKNTIYLSSFKNSGLVLSATYAIKNEFTDTFATKIQVASSILASANGILLETKQEIENATAIDVIVSRINMSPEEIKLLAKKIIFEGLVTANENFKILEDGSIEAVNGSFKGNIYLDSGNKVVGGDGLLTNLTFNSVGRFQSFDVLGFLVLSNTAGGQNYGYADVSLDFTIPNNFTIVSAYVTLHHTPALWSVYNESTGNMDDVWGYARNLKLYKVNQNSNYEFHMTYGSEYEYADSSMSLTEITNAFESSSYQPTNISGNSIDTKQTIDIKNSISKGHNKLVIRSSDSTPMNDEKTCCSKTGMARAEITIIGYISI